jgi:sec-independent protein translocase protein TatC
MADELEPIPNPEEEEEGGPVKSFLEHLEDLRWVLIKVISSVLIGMTVCLVASPILVKVLKLPLESSGIPTELKVLGPIGGFVISMKIAFWGGMTLALPFILFFIGQFVMPALKKNEKPYFRKAFIIGGGLFMVGVLLCYGFIIPIALKGMNEFNVWLELPTDIWRAEEYIQFVVMFMVGMGLSFEVPVLILTLVKMGIISHELMAKGRIWFFVINMVLCAFITPDAISTAFMVLPVQGLFEICLLISASWERRKKIEEARQRKLEEEADRAARERGEPGGAGA